MSILYLGLSQHMTDPSGETILGLSVDEHPKKEARDAAANAAAAGGTKATQEVAIHTPGKTTVALQVQTLENKIEIVIVTVEGTGQPEKNDADPARVYFTLTQDGLLKLKGTGYKISLVPLTPLLARLATSDLRRCQALIADGSQCQLRRTHQAWCFFHLEQKVLLHDEELEWRKSRHEHMTQADYMGVDHAGNIWNYNTIQESLALRTIITHTIYAGNEDDGHRKFVITTRKQRANLSSHLLTFHKSDGLGRVSISSCFDGFLAKAGARDTCPLSPAGWSDEVVVDVADVRKIRAYQGDGPTPPVFNMFADPSSTAMRDILNYKARRLGDLPDLAGYPAWKDMTDEQRCWDCARNGWSPPPTEEEQAVLHGPWEDIPSGPDWMQESEDGSKHWWCGFRLCFGCLNVLRRRQ
jgi:hypothetical protein